MPMLITLVARLKQISPRAWWFAGIAAFVIVVDQITKWLAVAGLTRAFEPLPSGDELPFGEKLSRFLWDHHPIRGEPVTVLDSFWHFRYAENPGAAWSFLAGAPQWFRTPFLLAISIAAMAFIIVYFRRLGLGQRLLRVALAMVFGGAVGNFFDRVRLGYVIDFIDWHWYDRATWPTFNVADSAISVGVALMVVDMLIQRVSAARVVTARGDG